MTLPALPTNSDPRRIAVTVNAMLQGRSNATGQLTLQAGAATTTVLDARAGPGSVVLLCPLTASAAAESPWISHRGQGTFTVSHANDPGTGRTFAFVILG